MQFFGSNQGYYPNQNAYDQWIQVNTVDNFVSTTSMCFDKHEEILWSGGANGKINSYLSSKFNKYSSFYVSKNDNFVNQILPEQTHIISLSNDTIKCHSKGGLQLLSYKNENFSNLLCFSPHDIMNRSKLAITGNTTDLFSLDIVKEKVINQTKMKEGSCVLKFGKYLASGSVNGTLNLMDPKSFKLEHSFPCHSGTISDVDIKENLLVTCGFSHRYGEYVVDQMVKAFDIRTNRLLNQIHFAAGPGFLKFHPLFSNLLCVASQTGYFQFRDVQSTGIKTSNMGLVFQTLLNQGDYIESFDLSSNGEVLAFGDSSGYSHIWSFYDDFQMNNYSIETEIPIIPNLKHEYNENISLNIPVDFTNDIFLSDWLPQSNIPIGKLHPQIHPQILNNLQKTKYGGIVKNPGLSKSKHGYINIMKDEIKELNVIPREYKKIKTSDLETKKKTFEKINYSKFNQTKYTGLENNLLDSFINPFLQILYNIKPLRISFLNHLCDKKYCLSCELDMMQKLENESKEKTFDAHNFLRTFRHLKVMNKLDLFFNQNTPIDILVFEFNRFLMIEIYNETVKDQYEIFDSTLFKKSFIQSNFLNKQNFLNLLFGFDNISISTCSNCGFSKKNQQHQLLFESKKLKYSSFENLMKNVLTSFEKTQNYCSNCKNYSIFDESNMTSNLPTIFNLNLPSNFDSKFEISERFIISTDNFGWKIQSLKENQNLPSIKTKSTCYELSSIISIIKNPLNENDRGHIVAYIKKMENGKSKWILYNDFNVSYVSNPWKNKPWKNHCVLFYQRVEINSIIPQIKFKNPIVPTILCLEAQNLKNLVKTFSALNFNELPKKGDRVAIDTECINITLNNSSILSIGRISIIREFDNVPFIDDYIETDEEVSDYLTRFSGLQIGDLDSKTSSHLTTNLKSSYLKIRALIDLGVIFVGHGLDQDWKILNLIVPQNQIIDTVKLYQLPNQRKIGLRFLSFYLLGKDIQSEIHDSVEDAKIALDLYHLYLKYQELKKFEQVLSKLYEIGRSCNWQCEELKEIDELFQIK